MLIIKNILWSSIIVILFYCGLLFSLKLSFPQFMWKKIIKGLKSNKNEGLSPINSLLVGLGGRIGVGSLTGVALAIYYGKEGSIFWIWTFGLIISVISFCESYLGIKYQIKDKKEYRGGPSYYIKKGLNKKRLSFIYSILVIFTYIFGFISIQSNTISIFISMTFKIKKIIIGLIISVITIITIRKGITRIAKISSKIVPFFIMIYIIIGIIVFINNINILPDIIKRIITNAFNYKSFISGLLIGVERVVFITESGTGTLAISSSISTSNNKKNLALTQILGTLFTIFIVSNITALLILTSTYNLNGLSNLNGIEIIIYVFKYHLNKYGILILALLIIMFSYTTIISCYYYGETCLKIINSKKIYTFILKCITMLVIILSSIINSNVLWDITDIFLGLLTIINIYSLYKLRNEIIIDYYHEK